MRMVSLVGFGIAIDLFGTTLLCMAQASLPNILFIAVDDLRPSLGCYGDPVAITPHMDRLASTGTRFDRAYCQVAVCNPSRASLMTGLRPDTLGVWTLPIHFREAKPDAITLPQWLRRFGYTAVSHGKIFHNPTPDPQSWSEPIDSLPALPEVYPEGTRDRIREQMNELPKGDWRKNNLRGPATAAPDLPDDQLLDGARTAMCISDLRRLAKADKPFFLAMGYIRPHLAFVAPKRYWDLYDPSHLSVPIDQRVPDDSPRYGMHNNSEFSHYVDLVDMPTPWDDRELEMSRARRLVHGYHACVSYVDAQIGRLLDALEEEGLSESTIVVLWSDHGYKLGEYRGWGKMTNYEIDTRVPLIIVAPGFNTAGQVTNSFAELLDIYPTLCELAGVPIPDFVEGRSLVPVLRDANSQVHRRSISQYYRRSGESQYMGYALRNESYRYVEWRDFQTGQVVSQELYDHEQDLASNRLGGDEQNIANSVSPDLLSMLSRSLESTHPPRRLQMTPAVRTSPSGSARLRVDFSIRNESNVAITVYPILPNGRRNRGTQIAPGQSHNYSARLGGIFVVESQDGSIHEIHSPNWPPRPVVISPPDS